MAELKITLTEQDLARLPKNVSTALLEYLQLKQKPEPAQPEPTKNSFLFEYAPEWMAMNRPQKQRKLIILSADEAYKFSRALFDQELPIFKRFFKTEPMTFTHGEACEKLKVFDKLGNWGAFGALAFLCGLDGPHKIRTPVTVVEMVLHMQRHGLDRRYDGRAVGPLLRMVRRKLNEFYQEKNAFYLYAFTNLTSLVVEPQALIFATGTREAFNEALTKIVNE
tara:strand:- start:76 stop:744 length:669 start_codon:yes stop_codon:yes gene_type:complete